MPDRHSKKIKKEKRIDKGAFFSHISSENIPTTQKKPAFSFEHLQTSHCISACEDQDKLAFVNSMRKLSQLTWQQIRNADRHGLGSEKIERDSFIVQIPSWVKEDVAFIAIRFSGLKPMVGYQEDRIFQIMWFDKDYNVYRHGS
jgi:hypothetical protein